MVLPVDRRNGKSTHLDLYRIPTAQSLSVFPIKRHGGFGSSIIGDKTTEDNMVRKYHGAERQDVGAHGCYQNGRDTSKVRLEEKKNVELLFVE